MSEYAQGAGAQTLEPEAGMLDLWMGRILHVGAAVGRGRPLVVGWKDGETITDVSGDGIAPDLSDPATRYLALAQLARRVGLDPTWQVALRMVPDGWALDAGGVLLLLLAHGEDHATGGLTYAGVRKIREIDTTDPTEALDRALWATREVEP